MAQQRKDIQQIRLFDAEDRKRAWHYGRKAGKQEILSDKQEDLQPPFFDGLFQRLFQRYGEENEHRTRRLS